MSFDYKNCDDLDELIPYAKSLGITVKHNTGLQTLKDKIDSALSGQVAMAKTEPEPIAAQKEERVDIVILKNENDSGSNVVPVMVNGKTYAIQRGEKVNVPKSVVEVLKNAVKTVYSSNKELSETESRDVPSYPFSMA